MNTEIKYKNYIIQKPVKTSNKKFKESRWSVFAPTGEIVAVTTFLTHKPELEIRALNRAKRMVLGHRMGLAEPNAVKDKKEQKIPFTLLRSVDELWDCFVNMPREDQIQLLTKMERWKSAHRTWLRGMSLQEAEVFQSTQYVKKIGDAWYMYPVTVPGAKHSLIKIAENIIKLIDSQQTH